MSFINTFATWEQYIIYLRKSRQDDPRETVEEVLEKHETMLQEYAVREFGHKIPERNIYREVVSGESISEREEIKEVLARIQDPNIVGVLVVEPSRLSRGDLVDCGHLIDAFRYSKTQVVTPYMTYDLEKKMERKFFQDELLRGNDYLEYTKEILWRGRVAAAKRGCYALGSPAPYGYKKVKVGKDWILEIVPERADIIRLIFDWYTKDTLGPTAIAKKLTEMGIQSPSGGNKWSEPTIRKIISNKHYIGLIVFNQKKLTTFYEFGEKVKRAVMQNPEDIIIAPGKHKAIIDNETFELAQATTLQNPRLKEDFELKNSLTGLVRCGKCGALMRRQVLQNQEPRYACVAHKPRCFKSAIISEMEKALIVALEKVELPALRLKAQNDEGNAMKIQQRIVAKLREQVSELEAQEDTLYEYLETKVYTPEVFARRHAVLATKLESARADLEKAKRAMPKSVDYNERAEALEKAIEAFKSPDLSAEDKNKMLKSVIERIEFHGTPINKAKRGENDFSLRTFIRL